MKVVKRTFFTSLVLLAAFALASGQADFCKTKYPIVLVHGLLGFTSLFSTIDYWYRIPQTLEKDGATVFITKTSQLNSTERRGEQVIRQLEEITAKTGATKFNLIGHSHGGLDVRYVLAKRPDLIASVTTIATPHKGAEFADYLRRRFGKNSLFEKLAILWTTSLANIVARASNMRQRQNALAALESLTSDEMAKFNQLYPAGVPQDACGEGEHQAHDIPLYSWSGIAVHTSWLDPVDLLFVTTSRVYQEENDGLVGRCSSHFGMVIRDDYPLNHLDLVNGFWGQVPNTDVHPLEIFRQHAHRLQEAGL